jgi:hypothetical protein
MISPLLILWLNDKVRGYAITQTVSRRVPTSAARVLSQVINTGFVVDRVAMGHVSSEYFSFSNQFLFHKLFHVN